VRVRRDPSGIDLLSDPERQTVKISLLSIGITALSILCPGGAYATVEALRAVQQSELSIRCQWSFEGADMAAALKSTASTSGYNLTAHGAGLAVVPGSGTKSKALKLPGGSTYAETPFGYVSPSTGTLEVIVTPEDAATQHGTIMRTHWLPGPNMNSFGLLEEHERTISAVVGKDADQPLVGGRSAVPFKAGDSYYVVLTYSYHVGDGPGGSDNAVFKIDGYAKNLTCRGKLVHVVDARVAAHDDGLGWAMFALGRDPGGNGHPWRGHLDEVAFYDTVLNIKTITWHAAALANLNSPHKPVSGSKFVDKTAELGIIWPYHENPKPGLNSRHTAAWADLDGDGYVNLSDGLL